jgi:hypothetical protein
VEETQQGSSIMKEVAPEHCPQILYAPCTCVSGIFLRSQMTHLKIGPSFFASMVTVAPHVYSIPFVFIHIPERFTKQFPFFQDIHMLWETVMEILMHIGRR